MTNCEIASGTTSPRNDDKVAPLLNMSLRVPHSPSFRAKRRISSFRSGQTRAKQSFILGTYARLY